MPNVPALRLNKILRRYRQAEAPLEVLRGADLSLFNGQSVALVAPSGAGKSTLLHIAGLLETPDAGEVLVDGRETAALGDDARTALRRSKIGFVYQFHHLLPEFTAMENIVLPQVIGGLCKDQALARAGELLSFLKLSARSDNRPSELSGGEQQRVAIARAIANGPSILLADEPTGNLDPKTAHFVFEMLTAIVKDTGLAALIATHNMELAGRMDRRVTLEDGLVQELA